MRLLAPALVVGWLAWLVALPPRPSAWTVAASGLPILGLISWRCCRGTHVPWSVCLRQSADLHILALVLLFALGVQMEDTHGVTSDGVIYFSQLRSVIFDGDLNVAQEFAFLDQPARPSHVVPIGTTIVWLPFYVAVAAVDTAGRAIGWWLPPADPTGTGLTLPYVRAALISSFLIGAIGLIAVHLRLRQEFGSATALVTTVLLFAATPLVWYMVYEPSMTHAASFGFVALFVVAAGRWVRPDMERPLAIVLGSLLGLAVVTRPQEALFALVPAVLLLLGPWSWRERLTGGVRLAGWALVGLAPWLLLQALHSFVLLSREPFIVAGEGGYLDVWRSRWADTLWSSWHGFFSWHPVAYVAAVGTAAYARRQARWSVAALVVLLAMAWVNGATTDWAGGWSFGGRRFTSLLAVLAPGLALVVEALVRRPMIALSVLAAAAIVWHQLLVAQYASGLIARDDPPPFDRIVRQQAALATREPFVYPFAFPANAWFAWRTGLPIHRYDLLGPESLLPSIDLTMSAEAAKYLLDGWGDAASDPFGPLRWVSPGGAELVLPIDPPDSHGMLLRIRARTRSVRTAAAPELTVSVNGHVAGALTAPMERPLDAVFELRPAVVSRGFNRIVLHSAPGSLPVAIYRIALEPLNKGAER